MINIIIDRRVLIFIMILFFIDKVQYMNKAFIFPGQGSQAVGMGKDLANNFSVAREVFEIVDEALAQNLSNMIFEGPIENLTMT